MKIGILGGGQLSRMLALAGIPLGFDFTFYFPKAEHSLAQLGKIVHGSFDDYYQLAEFAQKVDVITYENENIPWQSISYLMNLKPVFPDSKAIMISQDRLLEKNFFVKHGIPTNQFIEVKCRSDIHNAVKQFGYPLILKKRTHGYDGKGQYKLIQKCSFEDIPSDFFHNTIAEEYVSFEREVSLILAKNSYGTVCYDLCENIHRDGILIQTKNIKQDYFYNLARSYVEKIADELSYIGVIAVEFFQTADKLIANEMAPRVHNSGHWTIDACIASQFENHLRAIANLPLGNPASLTGAIMFNILNKMPEKTKLFEFNNLCFHDYDKTAARGRKLGHVTLLGEHCNVNIPL